jgi:hypothetical protein
MTAITIKKEIFQNIKQDVIIHIYSNEIESNVFLDAQKIVDIPRENGWKVSGFEKIPLVLV